MPHYVVLASSADCFLFETLHQIAIATLYVTISCSCYSVLCERKLNGNCCVIAVIMNLSKSRNGIFMPSVFGQWHFLWAGLLLLCCLHIVCLYHQFSRCNVSSIQIFSVRCCGETLCVDDGSVHDVCLLQRNVYAVYLSSCAN